MGNKVRSGQLGKLWDHSTSLPLPLHEQRLGLGSWLGKLSKIKLGIGSSKAQA